MNLLPLIPRSKNPTRKRPATRISGDFMDTVFLSGNARIFSNDFQWFPVENSTERSEVTRKIRTFPSLNTASIIRWIPVGNVILRGDSCRKRRLSCQFLREKHGSGGRNHHPGLLMTRYFWVGVNRIDWSWTNGNQKYSISIVHNCRFPSLFYANSDQLSIFHLLLLVDWFQCKTKNTELIEVRLDFDQFRIRTQLELSRTVVKYRHQQRFSPLKVVFIRQLVSGIAASPISSKWLYQK